MPVAPLPKRIAAYIIDYIVVIFISVIPGEIIGMSSSIVFIYISTTLVWIVYGIICDTQQEGRSVGKSAVSIETRQADGSMLTTRHAVLRNIVKAPLLMIGMPVLLLLVVRQKDQRAVHDLAAGTAVFEKKY